MAGGAEFEIQEAIENDAKADSYLAGILAYGQAKGAYFARSEDKLTWIKIRKKAAIYLAVIMALCIGIYFLQPFKAFLFIGSMITVGLSVYVALDFYNEVKKAGAILIVAITTFFVLLASGKYTFDEIAEFGRDAAEKKAGIEKPRTDTISQSVDTVSTKPNR